MSITNREELPDRFYIQASQVRRLNVVLKEFAKEAGLAKAFKHREILSHWKDIIGEENCKHTRLTGLKRGSLSIEVDSAVLLHHLTNFCKEDILRELQIRCKSAFVTNILFKVGASKVI